MTPETAHFLIPRDMHEKGYGKYDYIINFKHYVIRSAATLIVKADNEYFYLIRYAIGVSISSDFGDFDLNDAGINELQHKHQGTITIKNYSKKTLRIKFMQVILKQK